MSHAPGMRAVWMAISNAVRKANQLNNQPSVVGGLRDPQIVLLSCGLDRLVKGLGQSSLSQPSNSI